MRLAISAVESDLDASIDPRFGRAMHFLFVDSETMEFESVDNSKNRNAMGGAGVASAELVSERGAEAVITGHLGPKAFSGLAAAGLEGYGAEGMTVREAIEAFCADRLEKLSEGKSMKGA